MGTTGTIVVILLIYFLFYYQPQPPVVAAASVPYPDNSTDYGTRMCFDTMLISTNTEVVAIETQSFLCPLWKLNKRHVYGAQFNDDRTQLIELVAYPYSAHLPNSYFLETYDPASGALLTSVEMKNILLPLPQMANLDASHISLCVTSRDVYLAWSGTFQHFDRQTGASRPVATATFNGFITQSDRIWLACSNSMIFASIPAANAVWQIEPTYGRVDRIVASVQSPGALTVDPLLGQLRVASGRPVVRIFTFDIGSNQLSNLGTLATAADNNHGYMGLQSTLRAIAVVSQDPLMIATLTDSLDLNMLAAPHVVFNQLIPDVTRAQILLSDGRTVLVNGLPLDTIYGEPIGSQMDSALINAGNIDQVVHVAYTPDYRRNLIVIDRLGSVFMFSTFDHKCPVSLLQVLPPLLSASASILYITNDVADPEMIYTIDNGQTLVVRPSIGDKYEIVNTSVCPPGVRVSRALNSYRLPSVICYLCDEILDCTIGFEYNTMGLTAGNVRYTLPAEVQADPSLIRMLWGDSECTEIIIFYGSQQRQQIWTLQLPLALNDTTAGWVRQHDIVSTIDSSTILDASYWDVQKPSDNLYFVRSALDVAVLIDSSVRGNYSIVHRVDFVDKTLLVGASILLVPNFNQDLSDAGFSSDSICVGYPPNSTIPVEPHHRLTKQQLHTYRTLRAFAIVACVLCGLVCSAMFIVTFFYNYTPEWMEQLTLSTRDLIKRKRPWSRVDHDVDNTPAPPGLFKTLFCGPSIQNFLISMDCCCGGAQGGIFLRLAGSMERFRDPTGHYPSSVSLNTRGRFDREPNLSEDPVDPNDLAGFVDPENLDNVDTEKHDIVQLTPPPTPRTEPAVATAAAATVTDVGEEL